MLFKKYGLNLRVTSQSLFIKKCPPPPLFWHLAVESTSLVLKQKHTAVSNWTSGPNVSVGIYHLVSCQDSFSDSFESEIQISGGT